MRPIGMAEDGLIVGVYLIIMTPEFTRLNASNVPTDIALDKLSKLMKKARIAVNTPVIIVPTKGISVVLVVHLNMGNNKP